jgi:aspartate carbamoyltransferase catalytic subunit
MKLTHIIEVQQFKSKELLDEIFLLAFQMERLDEKCDTSLLLPSSPRKKILATLFYEPSTRTRLSFESAMKRLGGEVISTEDAPHFSSVVKGESLTDTIRVIGMFADAIVLRHHEEGSAKRAAEISPVPIINAGDGTGQHPTQALLDLYTIKKELGRTDGLVVGFVGDLLYSRTVHSLVYLLAHQQDITFFFVSPEEIKMPRDIIRYLKEKGADFSETESLVNVIEDVDLLYVTRIQKERFRSTEAYERVKDYYVVDKKMLSMMKPSARILHPLPRVAEIAEEVDKDYRAAYFRQADNGLYIRMALLKMILG